MNKKIITAQNYKRLWLFIIKYVQNNVKIEPTTLIISILNQNSLFCPPSYRRAPLPLRTTPELKNPFQERPIQRNAASFLYVEILLHGKTNLLTLQKIQKQGHTGYRANIKT